MHKLQWLQIPSSLNRSYFLPQNDPAYFWESPDKCLLHIQKLHSFIQLICIELPPCVKGHSRIVQASLSWPSWGIHSIVLGLLQFSFVNIQCWQAAGRKVYHCLCWESSLWNTWPRTCQERCLPIFSMPPIICVRTMLDSMRKWRKWPFSIWCHSLTCGPQSRAASSWRKRSVALGTQNQSKALSVIFSSL